MNKKSNVVVVTQSNYIPWKGYFDMILNSDLLIFLDDVQYTRRDWRNRNKIKTIAGSSWLTIPTNNKGSHSKDRICEVDILDKEWGIKHWNLITESYRKAPYFKEIEELLYPLYEKASEIDFLSKVNHKFITAICQYLDIKTKISWSTDYFSLEELRDFGPTERLVNLCEKSDASKYISGPAAKSYMDTDLFCDKNIDVCFSDYSNYPVYKQLHDGFKHDVSIIDMLMMLGKDSVNFFKSRELIYDE